MHLPAAGGLVGAGGPAEGGGGSPDIRGPRGLQGDCLFLLGVWA